MVLLVNIWFAFLGLGSNKLRSALTTLGVIIGVAAVIMIVSLGDGLRRSTQQQLEAFSSGTIEVRSSGVNFKIMEAMAQSQGQQGARVQSRNLAQMRVPTLNQRDVEALRQLATSVTAAIPQFEANAQVVYQGASLPIGQIVGVPPEYLQVYRSEIKWGRFVTRADEEAAAQVLVLDEMLATEIFGDGVNPVGTIVRVTVNKVTQDYTIVGVLRAKEGAVAFTSRSVLTPLRTAQLRMNTGVKDAISLIAARVDSRDAETRRYAVAQINTILRARHGLAPDAPEDYTVRDTLSFSEEQARILQIMTLILSLIAGISLVVGSIGLMNIMLVSVSERTYEIGLRRALGGRQIDILAQFLTEASMLSLLGGLIGLGLGVGGSYIASLMIEQLTGMVWVTADVILIALGVSSAVGILAGIYPAWRAALLQPTQALRHG